jgi:hypothetical protein
MKLKHGLTAGIITIAALLLAMLTVAPGRQTEAQGLINTQIVDYAAGNDPCQNPLIAKSSASIAITSATTTKLVAASTGKKVYVCGVKATIAGTTPTIEFEYGTKVSTECDTGATALTGAFAPTAGSILGIGDGGQVQFQTIASNELCAVTTGTSPSFQGFLVYVQQ